MWLWRLAEAAEIHVWNMPEIRQYKYVVLAPEYVQSVYSTSVTRNFLIFLHSYMIMCKLRVD